MCVDMKNRFSEARAISFLQQTEAKSSPLTKKRIQQK